MVMVLVESMADCGDACSRFHWDPMAVEIAILVVDKVKKSIELHLLVAARVREQRRRQYSNRDRGSKQQSPCPRESYLNTR
jgi:hypothetical protein